MDFAAPSSPPPPPPFAEGWAGAATAIHAIRQIAHPILVSLEPDVGPPIAIDLRYNTYVWPTPLRDFPAEPGQVRVSTFPIAGDSPGLAGAARGLDPLLWMIGLHAFPDSMASWLRPGDRYRLKRWPELDLLPHTPPQLITVKKLASSLMTLDKLAQRAAVDETTAQQVVNALSLMGALRRLESRSAAPSQPPITPEFELPDRVRGKHVRRGG